MDRKLNLKNSQIRLRRVLSAATICLTVSVVLFCGPPKPREVPGEVRGEEPVPPYNVLEAKLKSEIWGERSEAILGVMRGRYTQAVPELTRLLSGDPHPAVRQTAALALGDFQARAAGPVIGRMIVADKETGPEFLMDALIRMNDPANAKFVLPMLESERDVLRLKAVETLGELRATHIAGAVLSQAERNRTSEKARTYAMALGVIEARAAAPYLIGLAGREPAGPTLAATYLALGRIGAKSGVPVLAQALVKDFEKGRENAVVALIQIKDPAALARMFPLLEDNDDRSVRFSAAEVIAGIPDAASGPRALTLLKKREAKTIAPAAYIIGRLKYLPAREEIEIQLSDAHAPEREALARSLGWLGRSESVPLLLRVLAEQTGEGRYGAAWALGILGDERALEPLRKAAGSEDRKLALYATEALGGLASPQALPELRDAVENRPETRYAAIDAITVTPGDEARKILEGFALSSDLELQLAAIRALGQRKHAESIATLMQVVRDGKTESARAAMAALRNTTGLKYENRSQWKHWDEMRE